MIHIRCSIVVFSVLFPWFFLSADVYDFIPRHSEQVIQINLTDIPGMESFQKDLVGTVSRQTGFDGKSDQPVDISKDVAKILVVTPKLTEDETFIFAALKVPEKDFCRNLEKLTGSRHSIVRRGNRIERQFVLSEGNPFFGVPSKKRTFAYAFPGNGVAIFAKDTLDRYFGMKGLGLPKADRTALQNSRALAAGFTRISPQLQEDYPLLPPFYQTIYSLSAGPAGSIRLQGVFSCADTEAAALVQQQLQQYVTVGGFLLNQYDPELMREWMQQIKVQSSQTVVTVKGDLSRAFLDRLAAASERMSGDAAGKGTPPSKKSQGK